MESRIIHGASRRGRRTLTYSAWRGMFDRCFGENRADYPKYGGRGITVCDHWFWFANFLADMGEKPQGLSLGRINNDGNYEPDNCRWETRKMQQRNTTRTRMLTIDGVTRCTCDWCDISGISLTCLRNRLNHGWDVKKAVFTPSQRSRR